jgi:hypothetical protein
MSAATGHTRLGKHGNYAHRKQKLDNNFLLGDARNKIRGRKPSSANVLRFRLPSSGPNESQIHNSDHLLAIGNYGSRKNKKSLEPASTSNSKIDFATHKIHTCMPSELA